MRNSSRYRFSSPRVAVLFAPAVLTWTAHSASSVTGPNVNLTKTAGNQFETAAAINPNDTNQIFVVCRNEAGGLYTARSGDGGSSWTRQLIGRSTVPAPGDIPRAYGNPSAAWDSFGNLFLVYLSQS